jgi:predicted metal-dependent hydrolase
MLLMHTPYFAGCDKYNCSNCMEIIKRNAGKNEKIRFVEFIIEKAKIIYVRF